MAGQSAQNQPIKNQDPRKQVGLIIGFLRQLHLAWKLLFDRRVPRGPKLIWIGTWAYVLSPIDLLPDVVLGLGQLDDLVVLLAGTEWFISSCPPDVVAEHRRSIAGQPPTSTATGRENKDDQTIEAEFHVIREEEE